MAGVSQMAGGSRMGGSRYELQSEDFAVGLKTTTFIDPALRGLVFCLIELEDDALSLGHEMAARLIASARLALLETNGPRTEAKSEAVLEMAMQSD